jgi:tRNA-dihydrouridine synthase
MNNFWEKLDKNFLAMAPMAGITDSAFRQLCMSFGCDVSYSEMASATALFYDLKKPKNLKNSETLKLLEFSEMERPFVVQLFGSDPEHFKTATEIVTKQIKPDGIDINFGCPVKKIQKQGAGAVLMDNLPVAKKVIEAVIQNTDLPVSIKTRVKSQKKSYL